VGDFMVSQKDRELLGEIIKNMTLYGYKREDVAVMLHISATTLGRRLREPSTFTVAEVRTLQEKLNIKTENII